MSEHGRNLVYESGQWQVHLGRRELLASGVAVPIGARAFEIVEVLVQSANELVTKNDLMDRIWPGVAVGENTLQVHISAIRKAFGPDRAMLKTATGRGYRLVGSWTPRRHDSATAPVSVPQMREPGDPPANNFPLVAGRLIGRDAAARHVRDLISAYRVVTLTGPGGIGKTRLAIEAARDLVSGFDDGGWFIELASLSNPDLVPTAAASALGLKLTGDVSAEAVARAVGAKQVLVVLDNCEHVIDAAANLVEHFVRACPHTTILVTSREVPRIDGEMVYRVPPLDVPAPGQETPDHILGHGAVELFIERINALDLSFSSRAEELTSVAAICRQLDGIPLAIELAAGRVEAFGVRDLAARLDHRFGLLTSGRRAAMPHHRTLAAALDWSYRLLSPMERATLRRLSVFVGNFDLDGATAVAGGEHGASMVESLADLVHKSLVSANPSGVTPRYRLLNTTRLYAFERLRECGELEATRRRHAHYHHDLFARARGEWETAPTIEWLAAYGDRLDDLRAVLDWAFSLGGDVALGLALTVDAVPLWLQLSLMRECVQRVEAAASHIGSPTNENARLRMRLSTARNLARMYTADAVAEAIIDWRETLVLAEQVGDRDYQLRATWGLFADSFNRGEVRALLGFARRFAAIARDPADRLIGDRLIGTALHLLGDHDGARVFIERMLKGYTRPPHSSHIIRYQNDQIITARRVLVPLLWLQGYPDQATRMAEEAVGDAVALGHAQTLCNMLAQAACPVAFLAGDLALAERFTALLIEQSVRFSLGVWHAYGRCFEGISRIRRGDVDRGLDSLRTAGSGLNKSGFMRYHTPYLLGLAEGLAASRATEKGLVTIEQALSRAETTGEQWCLPELLRVKGELLRQIGTDEARIQAEQQFLASLACADRHRALSWQLRAAISLAELLLEDGRRRDGVSFLSAIHSRFSEGFDTADMKTAARLLVELDGTLATPMPPLNM